MDIILEQINKGIDDYNKKCKEEDIDSKAYHVTSYKVDIDQFK